MKRFWSPVCPARTNSWTAILILPPIHCEGVLISCGRHKSVDACFDTQPSQAQDPIGHFVGESNSRSVCSVALVRTVTPRITTSLAERQWRRDHFAATAQVNGKHVHTSDSRI